MINMVSNDNHSTILVTIILDVLTIFYYLLKIWLFVTKDWTLQSTRKPNVRISDSAEIQTIDGSVIYRSDFGRSGLGVSVRISDTLS